MRLTDDHPEPHLTSQSLISVLGTP